MFLDAEGNVLARVEGQTVKDWARARKQIDRYHALKKKAAGGDVAAQIEVALFECLLGKIDYDEMEERLEGKKLSDAQKKQMRALELDVEVRDALQILRAERRADDAYTSVGEDLAAVFKKGETPASENLRPAYWKIIMKYGLLKKDHALAKAAIKKLAKLYGEDDRRVKRLRERLESATK